MTQLSPELENSLDKMSPEDRDLVLNRVKEQLTSDSTLNGGPEIGSSRGAQGAFIVAALGAAVALYAYFHDTPQNEVPVTTYGR